MKIRRPTETKQSLHYHALSTHHSCRCRMSVFLRPILLQSSHCPIFPLLSSLPHLNSSLCSMWSAALSSSCIMSRKMSENLTSLLGPVPFKDGKRCSKNVATFRSLCMPQKWDMENAMENLSYPSSSSALASMRVVVLWPKSSSFGRLFQFGQILVIDSELSATSIGVSSSSSTVSSVWIWFSLSLSQCLPAAAWNGG